MQIRCSGLLLVLSIAGGLRAQSTLPTLIQAFPAQSLVPGGAAVTLDLRNYLSVPGVTGQVVQFDTVLGKFNVELLASAAPQHVTNFLNYVQAGAYTNSFFHRSVSFDAGAKSIVQGGGYTWSGSTATLVSNFAPVPLEYNLPNIRGTVAAPRLGNDINSATSGWYFNLRDNTTGLGPTNGGGFTVYGRVLGSGMTVVDAIGALNAIAAGGAFSDLPVRNYSGGAIGTPHLAIVNSVSVISLYPSGGTSLLQFTGGNSAPTVVRADLIGSSLVMTPLVPGTSTVTLRATDTQGNLAEGSLLVTVLQPPTFATQPVSQSAAAGGAVAFLVNATAASPVTYQWWYGGGAIPGATTPGITIDDVQPGLAGVYTAVATSTSSSATSRPAILGVLTSQKVIGNGTEIAADILHPNGNTFDQILLNGRAAVATADGGQVTRISYVDLNDDIVQIEFAGAGTVSMILAESSGPSAPAKYDQPAVSYMKGHVGIVVAGANETTNLSVFTVGRATAYDPTGAYNILLPPGDTNVPANNGSPLFVGQAATTYDGMADIAFVAITSTNGKFGGLRTANARYLAAAGPTGVYAPGIEFTGPVFVGDIIASAEAVPHLEIGSAGVEVRITGGDLLQENGRAVQVSGIAQLLFRQGSTSKGNLLPAQNNRAVLVQDGVDVSTQIVVNP